LNQEAAVNPLHWTREHRIAGTVVCTVGAFLGALLGFIHSPYFSLMQPSHFGEWVSLPQAYWRWPVLGFFISGLTFYSAQLLRKSN
jgi:hypothetical protein